VYRHPLAACFAKLIRADQHLAALNAEWEAFLDTEPYAVPFTHDASTPNRITAVAMSLVDPPLTLSLTLGDFAHNVRSALDHLVCRFVDPDSLGDELRNAFPIERSKASFERKFVPRGGGKSRLPLLEGISPRSDEWALIEGAQPYNQEERVHTHPLAILSELSNRDKHRSLNATFGYPDTDRLKDAIRWDPVDLTPVSVRQTVEAGQPVLVQQALVEFVFDPSGPPPDMYVDGVLPFQPRFAYGASVVTMGNLADIVRFARGLLESALAVAFADYPPGVEEPAV
jgi:hypothetical protein